MRIGGVPQILQRALVAGMKSVPAVQAAQQAVRTASGEVSAQPAPSMPPAHSVEMLVALSAAMPQSERTRQQAKYAERGLDRLEALRKALLRGTAKREELDELVEWVGERPKPEDSEFSELFNELEVRVRVELAKLDVEI